MTTSFAHFVRGNLLASLYVQPMGMLLALMTTAALWTGIYISLTGRRALSLLKLLPLRYYLLASMLLALIAWGWKIWIHLHGIDGWQ